MSDKLAYSLDEPAESLSVSRSAMKQLVYAQKIKSVKVGKRRLIPKWALTEFLSPASHETEGGTDWDGVPEKI